LAGEPRSIPSAARDRIPWADPGMANQLSLERPKTPEELLMRLDQDIRRFQIDFERFFSGNLPIPPDQRRIGIQNQIKELRTVRLKTVSLRFRYNTLEAKFNAFLVLFNRRLREHELGKVAARARSADGDIDPAIGIVVDEKPSTAATQALYNGLYADSDSGPKADFELFHSYLEKQARKIRQTTGCNQVRFRVAHEGGKTKLKAKPV
jgi:hypothetical protein